MKPGRPVGAPSEGGFSGSSNAVNPCRKRRFCLGVGGAEALFGAGPRTTSPKHHSLIHRRKLGEIKPKRKRYLKVSFFFRHLDCGADLGPIAGGGHPGVVRTFLSGPTKARVEWSGGSGRSLFPHTQTGSSEAQVVDSEPRGWYSACGPVAQLAVQETFNL